MRSGWFRRMVLYAALIALVAVVSNSDRLGNLFGSGDESDWVCYEDMEYVRPDLEELQQALENSCSTAETAGSLSKVVDAVYDFYAVYDRFYTNYALADIRYSSDLTDPYWEEEYNFCAQNISAADAALEELYRTLAGSRLRAALEGEDYFGPGFFDAYDDEESVWDEGFLALMEEEATLQGRYYELCDEAMDAGESGQQALFLSMAELLVDLVEVRQEIAAYVGYSSYVDFAYDFYYYRDYTPAQAQEYLDQVSEALCEPYRELADSDVWDLMYRPNSEEATFAYVKEAANAMGGTFAEAFELLEGAGLYDIRYSENKYGSSFEIYLWSYYEPFIFMSPYLDQMDKLIFAHEFGHFLNDYVCWGSYAGTDVTEVHSQAFEYLSLCYSEDAEELTRCKMADSLCTYMEQAAYAMFEHRLYRLTDEELTVENVTALYEEVSLQFCQDIWGEAGLEYVTVPHFFTDPLYTLSYVLSNDLAIQFYQLEQAEPGAGLELYEQCLDTHETFLLVFAETYGLESPFAEGRLAQVAETFRLLLEQ